MWSGSGGLETTNLIGLDVGFHAFFLLHHTLVEMNKKCEYVEIYDSYILLYHMIIITLKVLGPQKVRSSQRGP